MPAVSRAIVSERHRIRQELIADVTAGRLGVYLRGMPDLGEEALAAYVERAYPSVAGGQRVAADTGALYARVLAARRLRRPLDVDAALARAGVLVTADSRSVVAPVLRARHLVAEGETMPAAITTAASYAGQLSAADMQAAMRVGVNEGANAADLDVQGWRKGPGPEACTWCQSIADNVYRDPDDVPFHDGDRCGVEPELDEQAAPQTYDDSDIPF